MSFPCPHAAGNSPIGWPGDLFEELRRDDNDDRVRVQVRCLACGVVAYGCFARRLGEPGTDDDQAAFRGAWGPVGVWTWSQ